MSQRKMMLGLPVALLLGGSAIAIGVVPGVRDWIDQTVPWLGINGPKITSYAMVKNEKNLGSSEIPLPQEPVKSVDTGLQTVESDKPQFEVQFAQAISPLSPQIPVQQPPTESKSNQSIRIAQVPTLNTVPSSGINVPSSGSGKLIVQGATVFFPDEIPVAAQADGIITKLPVDDGTIVQAGTLMIEIDTRLAEAEIEVSEKELLAANLKANDDSNLKYSKAALEVATMDVRISNILVTEGAEDKMANEKKKLEEKKANFQVNVSQIEKQRDTADVGVKTAKLGAAKVQVDLRRITAQRTGMVSELVKRQFSWVRAGEPILKLTSMDRIRIKGTTPRLTDYPYLLLNAPARVTIFFAEGKGETIEGSVTYVSPGTHGINQYQIHVDLQNRLTQDGQYLFREGMDAVVEITPRNN